MKKNYIEKNSFRMLSSFFICLCLFLGACSGKKVEAQFAEPKLSVKGNSISSAAKTQLGKKYRSGGTSPKTGFDCSGLVQWAYKVNGVKVPRVTSAQAKVGKRVLSKHARPGDIIVFRTGRSRTGLHTGIYVGNNKFIHSPRSGKSIRIDTINTYWKPRLISVRRLV